MLKKEIGTTLRLLREEKDWSQEQVARKVDTSKQVVSNVEAGKTASDIDKVARMFSVVGAQLGFYVIAEGSMAGHLGAPMSDLIRAASCLSEADIHRLVRVAAAFSEIEGDEGKDLAVRQLERESEMLKRRLQAG